MKKFLLAFSLFCFSLNAHVDIQECDSIQQLLSLARPGSSQLILLDIDNTLIHTKRMLGSDEWFTYYLKKEQANNPETAFHFVLDMWHAIQTVSSVIPMEEKTTDVIQILQKLNCPIMGLTTRGMALEHVTPRQLSSIGIQLDKTTPFLKTCTLKDLPSVLFSKGILFTNGTHKGKALKTLLEQIGWMPDQIIFINDKKAHIEETASSLPDQVHFLGLRYTVADAYVAQFDSHKADQQLQQFLDILQ